MTTVQHPPVEGLIEAPAIDSSAWDCVSGSEKAEYFSRSPWSRIIAYERGFVVKNIVTLGKHPVATWDLATSLRAQIASRYQTIATRAGW